MRHRRLRIAVIVIVILLAMPPWLRFADGAEAPVSTVGKSTRIGQLVLPGTEVEVKPIDDRVSPIVIRITDVFPHGSAFRYNLTYYGLEPGKFDLKNYLKRKDGTATADLPPIPVTIEAILPPGQIEPHALVPKVSPRFGSYRARMLLAAIAWSAGLVLILYLTRRKRVEQTDVGSAKPLTLAGRLRPLVEQAVSGQLDTAGQAELERLLIGYWRRKLKLEQNDPALLIITLKNHSEAGPLIRRLESWLHKPGGAPEVDLEVLLKPYQSISAEISDEALEGAPAASGGHS